ncbi:MAG: septum formation protein Maf [Candidatus Omnitrophica bacterium]|nr:septum formation protein Maf [Candidatus Omnitrophota bacterium]
MKQKKDIMLASASLRRSRILMDCKIKHMIYVSGAEEDMKGRRDISEIVQKNAICKASTVVEEVNDAEKYIVIGADTLVAFEGDIIGKPDDESTARNMLKRFSGKSLDVYTGVCVINCKEGKEAHGFEKSSINVISLEDKDIEKYFHLLAPYDKAGGFSIEGVGSMIFDNIVGSYFNILGLPMIKLAELFEEAEEDILDYVR